VNTENHVRAPAPTCPDPALWRQFQLGLLPEEEAERLQQHLEGCSACLAHLEAAPPQDPLVDALRPPAGAAAPPSEAPTVSHLVQRLKGARALRGRPRCFRAG
jgi:hypothetical protein